MSAKTGQVEAKLQALWTIEVRRSDRWSAAGVILFHVRRVFGDFYEEGRIFGGDQHRIYTGSYIIENYQLRGTLEVRPYAPDESELFGSESAMSFAFNAPIDRIVDRDVIELTARASPSSDAIALRLTRRAPLA